MDFYLYVLRVNHWESGAKDFQSFNDYRLLYCRLYYLRNLGVFYMFS